MNFKTITHCGVFSILIPHLSKLFVVNKFDSIALDFDLERIQSHQKNIRTKLKKKIINSKSIVKCKRIHIVSSYNGKSMRLYFYRLFGRSNIKNKF